MKQPERLNLISHPSRNFGPRSIDSKIDMLVLHYTGMPSGKMALQRLCDPQAQVSSHYLVEEDGRIFKLVAEEMRAWHAGRGVWQGCDDVNSSSIGIEMVNPGHEFGYRAFPAAQIASVISLAQDILSRHDIPADRIIAHADMSPERKEDPGELFPWSQLADHGIGLWPSEPCQPENAPADVTENELEQRMNGLLRDLGYGPAHPRACRIAFQRHWRPSCIDGAADRQCIRILENLLAQCDRLQAVRT